MEAFKALEETQEHKSKTAEDVAKQKETERGAPQVHRDPGRQGQRFVMLSATWTGRAGRQQVGSQRMRRKDAEKVRKAEEKLSEARSKAGTSATDSAKDIQDAEEALRIAHEKDAGGCATSWGAGRSSCCCCACSY